MAEDHPDATRERIKGRHTLRAIQEHGHDHPRDLQEHGHDHHIKDLQEHGHGVLHKAIVRTTIDVDASAEIAEMREIHQEDGPHDVNTREQMLLRNMRMQEDGHHKDLDTSAKLAATHKALMRELHQEDGHYDVTHFHLRHTRRALQEDGHQRDLDTTSDELEAAHKNQMELLKARNERRAMQKEGREDLDQHKTQRKADDMRKETGTQQQHPAHNSEPSLCIGGFLPKRSRCAQPMRAADAHSEGSEFTFGHFGSSGSKDRPLSGAGPTERDGLSKERHREELQWARAERALRMAHTPQKDKSTIQVTMENHIKRISQQATSVDHAHSLHEDAQKALLKEIHANLVGVAEGPSPGKQPDGPSLAKAETSVLEPSKPLNAAH